MQTNEWNSFFEEKCWGLHVKNTLRFWKAKSSSISFFGVETNALIYTLFDKFRKEHKVQKISGKKKKSENNREKRENKCERKKSEEIGINIINRGKLVEKRIWKTKK